MATLSKMTVNDANFRSYTSKVDGPVKCRERVARKPKCDQQDRPQCRRIRAAVPEEHMFMSGYPYVALTRAAVECGHPDVSKMLGCLQLELPDFKRLTPSGTELAKFTWQDHTVPLLDRLRSVTEYFTAVLEKAKDYSRRLYELGRLFRIELSQTELMRETEKFFVCELLGQSIRQIKTAVLLLWDEFVDQPPPEVKSSDLGFKWLPYRLVRRIRQTRKTTQGFVKVNSLYQGWKRGLMGMSDIEVAKTLDAHSKNLTQSRDHPEKERVLRRVEQLTQELGFAYRPVHEPEYLPSKSATVETSRALGGTLGHAIRLWYGEHRDYDLSRALEPATFVGYCREKTKWSHPLPVYIPGPTLAELVSECGALTTFADATVKAEVILEPLKGRIITKPTNFAYWKMISYQKQAWRFLRQFKPFRLTGETLKDEHLDELFEEFELMEAAGLDPKFNSGDYSSATDNLDADASKVVMEYWTRRLPFEERVNIFGYMTGNKVKYGKLLPGGAEYLGLDEIDQIWGQVMGCNLSFGVLCWLNYCGWHISCEDRIGKRIPLKGENGSLSAIPSLVNGDDILVVCDDTHYKGWGTVVAALGLIPSPGKNHFSSEIFTVNSALFWVRKDRTPDERGFTRVPYVNWGLATTRKKMDMSKDWTVSRVGEDFVIAASVDSDLPAWCGSILNTNRCAELYFGGLQGETRKFAEWLWDRHRGEQFSEFSRLLAKGAHREVKVNPPVDGELWQEFILRKAFDVTQAHTKERLFHEFACPRLWSTNLDGLNAKEYLRWSRRPIDCSKRDGELVRC